MALNNKKDDEMQSSKESVELHDAPAGTIPFTDDGSSGDYPPVRTFEELWHIWSTESSKLWAIGGPIAFNILCNYGINSFTNIFVGHIGEVQLSSVAIALSVVANFAFGFMFLQAQCKVWVMAWIGLVALIFHIIMLYCFIEVFKWGTTGAAWAYNLSAWGIALAQLAYVIGWCKDAWKGLSWLALHDIWPFVRLSIASALMICLEIWYFMTIIVLTGHLEDPILAVGMNVNGWEGMLFIGINAAISVRVSNELGAGRPRAAKYSVMITVGQSLCIGLMLMSLIMLTRDHFAALFTDSKELQHAVADLAYLLGITMVLNSIQPVISGVAVGGGWQALIAYINLFCYYVVGLPLGFFLGYKTNLGVQGIWIGMICGTLLQTLILIYMVCKTNWNKEVEQATERMKVWGGECEEKERLSFENMALSVVSLSPFEASKL
ncbi:hypothetical protein V2J09_001512 [Rumex salicifolius]